MSGTDQQKAEVEQKINEINQRLIITGEKERIKAEARIRLDECGWQEKMREYCKVMTNKGFHKVTLQDLVNEVIPKGIARIPTNIKAEILQRLFQILSDVP